ncbi:MAG: type II secretion system minor pseudopilin GspK, partial [Pseudomonadota bacterium]
AEELAKGSVRSFWVPGQDRQPALEAWVGQPFYFPIDGGTIQGEAKDGANCFNLNSLVRTEEGSGLIANPDTIAEFIRLLTHLDVIETEATGIATAAADWIDGDNIAGFSGAEDDYYGALETPYRTAGGAMVEPSEIKWVRGVTGDLYTRIRPYICTRPTIAPSVLNLNTLRDWQVPLMAALLGEDVDVSDAVELLEERPVSGFLEASEIAALQPIIDLDLQDGLVERLGIRSAYIDLNVQVRYKDVFLDMISSLQIGETGDITTLSRRYGSVE